MATALYIGRFQPFHNGHLAVIREILKNCDKIIIAIGSSQEKNTKKNPFSFNERKKMITVALKEARLQLSNFSFIAIADTFDDVAWIEKVLSKAQFDIAYTNNEWTKACFQSRGLKTHSTQYFAPYKGEFIRKRISKGKPWEDFVPKTVFDFIVKIKGDCRIAKLAKNS